jgi:hypothetical protein
VFGDYFASVIAPAGGDKKTGGPRAAARRFGLWEGLARATATAALGLGEILMQREFAQTIVAGLVVDHDGMTGADDRQAELGYGVLLCAASFRFW